MKEPFDCEGIAGAQQSLRQSRRKMQETRAAAHRRKKKGSLRLSCLEPLSHARSHFSVLHVSLKGLRKESFSACTVGYKITSFL